MHKWIAKAMKNDWTVTTTTFDKTDRYWGVRIEWTGLGFVFAVQASTAPAIRIILCGWSLYMGRILPRPKQVTLKIDDVARSKGWAASAQ